MKDHRVKIVVEKNHKINYFVKAKPAPRVSCQWEAEHASS